MLVLATICLVIPFLTWQQSAET